MSSISQNVEGETNLNPNDSNPQPITDSKNKTLRERIDGHTINTYNYHKHDGGFDQPDSIVTGQALLCNEVDFAIVDIDVHDTNKTEEDKAKIRDSFISKLPEDYVIVQTQSGGLHIYLNCSYIQPPKNRIIGFFKCPEYSIDIFAGIPGSKRSLVVLPGTKYRDDRDSPIREYVFVRGSFESKLNHELNEFLSIYNLTLDVSIKEDNLAQHKYHVPKRFHIKDDFFQLLLDGYNGVSLTADDFNSIFPSINCLPPQYIDKFYEHIYQHCNISETDRPKFEEFKTLCSCLRKNQYSLLIFLDKNNHDYFINVIQDYFFKMAPRPPQQTAKPSK